MLVPIVDVLKLIFIHYLSAASSNAERIYCHISLSPKKKKKIKEIIEKEKDS